MCTVMLECMLISNILYSKCGILSVIPLWSQTP